MDKKRYVVPNIISQVLDTEELMVLSNGEQQEEKVHDPNEEVSGGNALSRRNSNWEE